MNILFLLIMIALPIIASLMVQSTFNKYSNDASSNGLTGDGVARFILDRAGLQNVRIERISGSLTDHYDPRDNTVRLSDTVYGRSSISAIGVVAHECGHAIQHNTSYAPIKARTAIVPVTNICSHLWFIVVAIGALLSSIFPALLYIGIGMFAIVVLFQFITLPVELDASGRAIEILTDTNMVNNDEANKIRKVLLAAAFTYVVSLALSIMQLLRLLSRVRR